MTNSVVMTGVDLHTAVNMSALEWARAQFAMTAIFHFFFVPFTLGMSFIVAFMETIYLKTGKKEWKEVTQFWQLLFGINFAIGIATGIIHEFEFGTNWSNYSWVVGDIFGAPLAIEGIAAFFMEATFAAVSFFGWNRVGKTYHLASTWLVAIGSNLSALWILIANGFMQHPVGYTFNIDTMRAEMVNFWDLILQPVAQVKFLHVVSAGYTIASLFVVGISSFYLIRGVHKEFAVKSFKVGAAFGLVVSIFVAVIGDDHAYEVTNTQPSKIAAMEGLYVGEKGAPIVAFGFPTGAPVGSPESAAFAPFKIALPYALSILGKHSLNGFIPGLNDLLNGNKEYGILPTSELIKKGRKALEAMKDYHIAKKAGDTAKMAVDKKIFEANQKFMGYGYLTDPKQAFPPVKPLFYSFHIMVGLGFYFIFLFIVFYIMVMKEKVAQVSIWHKIALYSSPLPWIAISFGWITAEMGRQPWTVFGLLPTSASVTDIDVSNIKATFFMFLITFVALGIAEMKIFFNVIKHGPKGGH